MIYVRNKDEKKNKKCISTITEIFIHNKHIIKTCICITQLQREYFFCIVFRTSSMMTCVCDTGRKKAYATGCIPVIHTDVLRTVPLRKNQKRHRNTYSESQNRRKLHHVRSKQTAVELRSTCAQSRKRNRRGVSNPSTTACATQHRENRREGPATTKQRPCQQGESQVSDAEARLCAVYLGAGREKMAVVVCTQSI
jgi:hypothetical protein